MFLVVDFPYLGYSSCIMILLLGLLEMAENEDTPAFLIEHGQPVL